jgi:hypothetical protein
MLPVRSWQQATSRELSVLVTLISPSLQDTQLTAHLDAPNSKCSACMLHDCSFCRMRPGQHSCAAILCRVHLQLQRLWQPSPAGCHDQGLAGVQRQAHNWRRVTHHTPAYGT